MNNSKFRVKLNEMLVASDCTTIKEMLEKDVTLGMTNNKMAEKYDCSPSSIIRQLRIFGLYRRNLKSFDVIAKEKGYTGITQFLQRNQCKTKKVASDKLGCSLTTIYNLYKKWAEKKGNTNVG